jgi:hypothetical protein
MGFYEDRHVAFMGQEEPLQDQTEFSVGTGTVQVSNLAPN